MVNFAKINESFSLLEEKNMLDREGDAYPHKLLWVDGIVVSKESKKL